jgi:hypothetical protein
MKEIKHGLLALIASGWIFGLIERTTAALQDGFLSANDLTLLFTALGFGFLTVLVGIL